MAPEPTIHIYQTDVLDGLRALPDDAVDCIATSPPYFRLRDYQVPPTRWSDGTEVCLGLESQLAAYVSHLTEVFREARRALKPEGVLWLNIGDRYAAGGRHEEPRKYAVADSSKPRGGRQRGMSGKNLLMVPAEVALALRADGWILRQANVWHKPNAMCESTRDRTTWAYEMVYMLVRQERYYYDAAAIEEPVAASSMKRYRRVLEMNETYDPARHKHGAGTNPSPMEILTRGAARIVARGKRNKRNVWKIPTQPFKGAHFACWPEKLAEICILAGCPAGGVVLDPFCGSGRTGIVASRLGRRFIGFDAKGDYVDMARRAVGGAGGAGAEPIPAGSVLPAAGVGAAVADTAACASAHSSGAESQ